MVTPSVNSRQSLSESYVSRDPAVSELTVMVAVAVEPDGLCEEDDMLVMSGSSRGVGILND